MVNTLVNVMVIDGKQRLINGEEWWLMKILGVTCLTPVSLPGCPLDVPSNPSECPCFDKF